MIHRGPIPRGLFVMHSCDRPKCCNPEHLSVGTHWDNMADMRAKGRGRSGVGGLSRLVQRQMDALFPPPPEFHAGVFLPTAPPLVEVRARIPPHLLCELEAVAASTGGWTKDAILAYLLDVGLAVHGATQRHYGEEGGAVRRVPRDVAEQVFKAGLQ